MYGELQIDDSSRSTSSLGLLFKMQTLGAIQVLRNTVVGRGRGKFPGGGDVTDEYCSMLLALRGGGRVSITRKEVLRYT